MTLEQFADWLNAAAPKFVVARTMSGGQVVINRDSIVSAGKITSPRGEKGLLIVYGAPGGELGEYQQAFIPATPEGGWR